MTLLLATALGLGAGCGADHATGTLRLATTTSTENSGLLRHLLDPFEQQRGIRVHVIAVGTGQALQLGQRGDADVVLVHDRAREDAFVAAGYARARHDVMANDFVVVGPADDPAGIRGVYDPADALARIHAAKALFVSRGDASGTHAKEQRLWQTARVDPTDAATYLETGQGMGPSLIVADEKRAYVLTDRGTYLAFAKRLDLAVLVEGHPTLRNPYGVMAVRGANEGMARILIDYLLSPEGQARIDNFRIGGRQLFTASAKAR